MDDVLITIDIDWAPDFVLDLVCDHLVAKGVRATWLATHESAALDRIREYDTLFEIGIHPNFASGSTQGATPAEVLNHCLSIVPDASSVRSHGLVQSSAILDLLLIESRIAADLSVFLPEAPNLVPVDYTLRGRTIVRFPYFWEDDYEFLQPSPAWDLESRLETPGMKIFNFHPIHIYLNSSSESAYLELKARSGSIAAATRASTESLIGSEPGTRTFFDDLVDHLGASGGGHRVRDHLPGVRT